MTKKLPILLMAASFFTIAGAAVAPVPAMSVPPARLPLELY